MGYLLEVSVLPGWRWVNLVLATLCGCATLLLLFLFPDGRFVPRPTRWLVLVCTLAGFVWDFFQVVRGAESAAGITVAPVLAVAGLAAQIYRYRRVSGPLQRQQSKWVLVGFLGPTLVVVSYFLLYAPLLYGRVPLIVEGAYLLLSVILALSLPFAIVISILRYRLWDIDLLINRALVYGALSTSLALVYFGSVVVLQQLFRWLIGEGSTIAIVRSTLAIAALFTPLRRRIQRVIDHRFYRRKYDAARTLAAFSTRLRDEVDLQALTADLVTVVEETMQPARISLWLREKPRSQ